MPPPTGTSGPIRDPLHEEPPPPTEPATTSTETPADPAPSAPIRVQPEVVQPTPAPAAQQPQAQQPEEEPSEIWRRLHLVLGGNYIFPGVRVAGEAEPFHSAAAEHHGGGLLIQPTISAVRSKWFDLNLGLNFQHNWLSVPRGAGREPSDIGATTIGGLVEGNAFFGTPHFGAGVNAHLGYMGLSSDNADVGAPYSASLGFDGNVALGAQAYLHAWRGAFRLGGGINWMAGGLSLGAGAGNPDLLVSVDPMWSIFFGVDPLQIIRNAQGRAGERPGERE